jgi:hypothetical protein
MTCLLRPSDEAERMGMAYGTQIFIDFWNFQLNWNQRSGGENIDWTLVPRVLVDEAQKKLEAAGWSSPVFVDT